MRLTMKVNGRSTALFLAMMLLFCIQSLTLRLIGTDHADLLYHIHALLLGGAVLRRSSLFGITARRSC